MPDSRRLSTSQLLLLHSLGVGGGGEVWLARNASHELLAVKFLRAEIAADPVAMTALDALVRRIASLDASHLLRLEGLRIVDGRVCLVMEYAPGGDLSAIRGRPWREAVAAVLPVAAALAALHRAGIAHRDVKTSNVLRAADGSPRLADFDAAAFLGEIPRRGIAPGSLYTRSPQSLEGAPASIADDVYGYGAMLYELLSGYPPFYPDVTPERIRSEAPGRLDARTDVPEALRDLVARCLRKAPAQRPGSMEVVESELQRIVNEVASAVADSRSKQSMSTHEPSMHEPKGEPNAEAGERREAPIIRPPSAPVEPLRGEWRRTRYSAPDPREFRRQGFRRGLTVSAIALGVLALFIVFFALPKWVDTTPPVQDRPVAASAASEEPAAKSAEPERNAPLDFAALARAKQQADDLREPLFERLERMRERAAERWAPEDFHSATDELAAGDAQYEKREYLAAVQHFEALAPRVAALESQAGRALQAQLAAGAQALRSGRSEDARAAFELALLIEPKHAVAARGLERAGTLDRVLALLASARRAEQDGGNDTALADYRKALELDRDATQASEGIARITARQAGDAFASAMARGFAELGAHDYESARRAFENAGRIRPSSPEVAGALQQVEQSERTRTIASRLDAARAAEARERWADALQSYQDTLNLDSTVAAAKEGVARVQPRAELNAQIELYLTQPERLFSSPVRAAARQTLERASAIQTPGPVLSQQMATLRDWLAKANVPVIVALQSDNLTQVTVFRVGALGAFEQRSLELEPGQYTVVGTRPGYRDVRREIMVVPGKPMPPVVIRCEDKI